MRADIVAKIGGSLLGWPGLRGWLEGFLGEYRGSSLVLVAGGGAGADWVRRLDEAHRLGDEMAHGLAMRSMDLSAYVLDSIAVGCTIVEADGLSAAWLGGRTPILLTRELMIADDRESAEPLPHAWGVTSDSIAARIAERLRAAALILCKSAPAPSPTSRAAAARSGLVDPSFLRTARALPTVIYRNARDPSCRGVVLGAARL